jgi:ankyrin repeat protein
MQSHKELEKDLFKAVKQGYVEDVKLAITAIEERCQYIADLKETQPKLAKDWKIPNINASSISLSSYKNARGPVLHVAVKEGFHEIVELLIKARANVNLKGNVSVSDNEYTRHYDLSPLAMATITNNTTIMKSLIEAKANINEGYFFGLTLLMRAAKNGSCDALKVLLEEKADINRKDFLGFTALMYAAQTNKTKILTLLVENKADVKAKSYFARSTALSLASAANLPACVKILIEAEQKQIEETPIYSSSIFSSRLFHPSLSKSLLSPSVKEGTQASYSEKKGNIF